jgi:hypothetical protein
MGAKAKLPHNYVGTMVGNGGTSGNGVRSGFNVVKHFIFVTAAAAK